MKIAVAQTQPVKGDIQKNLKQHFDLIDQAIQRQTDMIIFPELSLTGYEPELAQELAVYVDDPQFEMIQQYSDTNNIIIGIGIPSKKYENEDKVCISLLIFQPHQARQLYSKQDLFETETQFFRRGEAQIYIDHLDECVAPAICFEISNPSRSSNAKQNGATIYIVSVLNSVNGIDSDLVKLAEIAQKHEMTVAMANFIGTSGGYQCAGMSSVWNKSGQLVGQLNNENIGLLIYDTKTEELLKVYSDRNV